MSDLRATERLLEVIEEQIHNVVETEDTAFTAIVDAITELRRRGDTLVRADDLRTVLEDAIPGDTEIVWPVGKLECFDAARGRLENALGGKLA